MSNKKIYKISILAILLVVAFFMRVHIKDWFYELKKIGLPSEIKYTYHIEPEDTSSGINLAVPFFAQAPDGDWSLPYLEACEETSALLVDSFYRGTELDTETVKQEIVKMVEWEDKRFGHNLDTTAQETAILLEEYFAYERVEVIYDFSIEALKKHLAMDRPVIVPVAGRLLNNPFYKAPGPVYHTLVVKGFTKDGDFITNDVGTRRGHNYVYKADIFYDAIHDGPENVNELDDETLEKEILSGRKAMIIVYPNE
ncbi:hypothetical protein C0580_01925 [Candidatus Parcubacteria bacterium]|nr:MAG: hypothetical protein C0580_01925 [Candidatus Parcubacteria bacterium]